MTSFEEFFEEFEEKARSAAVAAAKDEVRLNEPPQA